MTHSIITSTDLLPILCPDLYETAISPFSVFDWEQQQLAEELPESVDPYEMAIDMNLYCCRLTEYANEAIKAEVLPFLKKYGVVDIEAGTLHHPRYNQWGSNGFDVLDLKIIVDDEFFTKMAPELERMSKDEAAQQYCRDHWTDRPGFWSWMPGSVEEIMNGWTYFSEEKQKSAYLTLLCRENGILWRDEQTHENSDAQTVWEEKVSENLCFEDFISEEDRALIAANREEE